MNKYIGKTLSGKEFINLFPDISEKLAKLTNYEENHNGYKFKTGLNIDTNNFVPDKKCGNGIYFTDIDNMIRWISYIRKKELINFFNIFSLMDEKIVNTVFYRKVTLPLDCNIFIESMDKIKADKIILGDRIKITDLDFWKDENFCLRCIEKHNAEIAMMYIRNYSDKVNLALIKKNPFTLKNLIREKNLKISEEVQLEAVKRDSSVIAYIKNPSEEVQLEAVKRDSSVIAYIKSPSEEVRLAALNQNQNKKYI